MDNFFKSLGAISAKELPWEQRMGLAHEIGFSTALPMGLITGEEVNRFFAMQDEELASDEQVQTVRSVSATRSTCDCGAHDQFTIVNYSDVGIQKCHEKSAQKGIAEQDYVRPIGLFIADAHSGNVSMAMFDIADVEQLVNRLTEAVAEARLSYGE